MFENKNTKRPKKDSQIGLRLSMPEGNDEPCIISEGVNSLINIPDKPYQCRNSQYWVDDNLWD